MSLEDEKMDFLNLIHNCSNHDLEDSVTMYLI